MTQRNKLSSRLLSLILAMLMIVSMIPATEDDRLDDPGNSIRGSGI